MRKGEIKIKVSVPPTSYQGQMFFDRFALHWIDGLVAHIAEGSVADKPAPAVVVGQFSDQQGLRPAAVEETEMCQTRAYAETATEWSKAMARRFRELTRKEALGTIAPEEFLELERLTRDRRDLEYPRPADEVLWEINQRQVTANLVQALKKYVQFHEAPRPSRAGAR